MGRGVKIGGSRGPKCRLDPLLGPFLVILSHLGPFWAFFDPFWPFGRGAKAPSGSGHPKVGVKMVREIKIGVSLRPKWRLDPILGPFFGPFGPFLTPFGHLGEGQRPQVGPDHLKLG